MIKKVLYTLFVLFFVAFLPAMAGDFKISGMKNDFSNNVIMLNGNSSSANVTYTAGFSENPTRAYIDLENVIFVPNKETLEFKNSPISKVAIAQYSTRPNKVRLVFYSNSTDNLKKIKLIRNGNALTFKLKDFSTSALSMPIVFTDILPKDYKEDKNGSVDSEKFNKYILTNVTETKAGLLLSGVGNVKLARPFILTNPIRIVFDLQNAIVLKKDFYGEYKLSNGDSIKLGQFNNNTLRVVVTTNSPVSYKSFISPDIQLLHITNINDDVSVLPNTNISSVLKKVNLKVNSEKETYLTIEFDKPVIISPRRTYNKLLVDFLNVNYLANAEYFKANSTKQFGGFFTDKVTENSEKLALLIPVSDTLKTETSLSNDGKVLGIKLTGSLEAEKPVDQQNNNQEKKKALLPLSNKVIVIDAGHGGKDAGAISGKMYEKVPALSMALMLKKNLEDKGAKVIMTRNDDTYVTLQDRVSISNYENADLFVSIHLNSSEKSNIHGIETHWYKDNSKVFAECVQNHLMQNIKANNRGLFKSMFYVINHTTAPAILVETGFISNPEERDELFKQNRQKATAKSIADGIIEFVGKK